MKIIIADNNAWEKTIEVDKAVVRIGREVNNDIQLESPNIAPVHLQLHYLPEEFGCKVLNLGNEISISHGEEQEILRSYARANLKNGDELLLDAYRIRVQLPITTKTIQTSAAIQASLSFPNTTLYAHAPAVGWLRVKNIGEQSPSQFHVSVSGIQSDCIKIDPIPLLYAGAEEDVRIQLFHHGMFPYAGLAALDIRVFAPSDYPGEQVLIEQGIYVEPIFQQGLAFGDEPIVDVEKRVNAPDPNLVAQSTTSSVPSSVPPPPPPKAPPISPNGDEDDPISAPMTTKDIAEDIDDQYYAGDAVAVETKEKVSVQAKPTPKPMVVRDLPDEFWDESE